MAAQEIPQRRAKLFIYKYIFPQYLQTVVTARRHVTRLITVIAGIRLRAAADASQGKVNKKLGQSVRFKNAHKQRFGEKWGEDDEV